MWRGSCCVFVTLLLVIIGVAVDVLMVETGESGSFFRFSNHSGLRLGRNDMVN